MRHTGVAAASRDAGSIEMMRVAVGNDGDDDFVYDIGGNRGPSLETDFVLGFVLGGSGDVAVDADETGIVETPRLSRGDSFSLSGAGSPTELPCSLNRCSDDFEILLVKLPA